MKGRNCSGGSLVVSVSHPVLIFNIYTHYFNSFAVNAILFTFSFFLAVILPNRCNIPWLVKSPMAQADFCCSTHSSQVDENQKEPIKLCLQDQELDFDEPRGSFPTQDILSFYDSR